MMTGLQRGGQGCSDSFFVFVEGAAGFRVDWLFLSRGQRNSSRLPDWVFVRVLTIFEGSADDGCADCLFVWGTL